MKALSTTKQVEIIDKKLFTKVALDKNVEAFVKNITSVSLHLILIHSAQEAQIALLITEDISILAKYLDFSDTFPNEKVSKITNLNQHAIELQDGYWLLCKLIYSLGLIKLKI